MISKSGFLLCAPTWATHKNIPSIDSVHYKANRRFKGEAQQLEHYKKPEFKNENKQDQKQAQYKEDAPEKKQHKIAKMKV